MQSTSVHPGRHARRLALLIGLLPVAGRCVTWDYVPKVGVGVRYETNPEYTSNSDLEDDAYAGIFDARLEIRGETGGRSRFRAEPRVRLAAYTGSESNSDLNSTDYYLPVNGLWTNERSQYGLGAGYSQISTRNSEIQVTDPNNPGQPGSSGRIIDVDEDQERWWVTPSASFQITQRNSFEISASYDDVEYTKAELTNRYNYDYGSVNASWIRLLGVKSRVSVGLNFDAYRAEQPNSPVENETLTYGADVGYEYAFSDVTTIGVTAGTSRSDITITGLALIDDDEDPTTPLIPCFDPVQQSLVPCELRTDDKNFVGQIFIRQRTADTITTELRVSRSIQPNSDGAQVTQDAIRGYIAKDLTPLLGLSVGATYLRQEAVGKKTGSLSQRFDRDYAQAEANLNWRLSRTWSINAGYFFTSDEQTSGISSSTLNHAVSLELRYSGLGSH